MLKAQKRKEEARRNRISQRSKLLTNMTFEDRSPDEILAALRSSSAPHNLDSELPTRLRAPSLKSSAADTTTSKPSFHSSSSRSNSVPDRLARAGSHIARNRDELFSTNEQRKSQYPQDTKISKASLQNGESSFLAYSEGQGDDADDELAMAIKASLLDAQQSNEQQKQREAKNEIKSNRSEKVTHKRDDSSSNIKKSSSNDVSMNNNSNIIHSNGSSSRLPKSTSSLSTQKKISSADPKGRHVLIQRQPGAEYTQPSHSSTSSRTTSMTTKNEISLQDRSLHDVNQSSRSQKRSADEVIRPLLRDHLHRGRDLPAWLSSSVEADTQDHLLEMAIANSLSEEVHDLHDNNSTMANDAKAVFEDVAPVVEYCEEDEMLARALHESLNGF